MKLELVSIRKFYDQFETPFDLNNTSRASCSILRGRTKTNVPAPLVQSGVVDCPPLRDLELAEVSICYLPNVLVTHTGALILEDKYLIEESLEGGVTTNGLTEKEGEIFFEEDWQESDEVLLNINKYGTFNYSIFISEILPMALVASFVPGLDELKTRMFFPDFLGEDAIQLRFQLLSLFGMSADRIVRASKQAIRPKGVVFIKVNDRYRNYRNSQVLQFIAAVIRGAMATASETIHRNVYVSRQKAPSRWISNFGQFEKNVISHFDFHSAELEAMPLAEQVNLFAKADVVLAEHGAALINTIFMRPGTIVVEVFPKPMVARWMYRVIAHQFRLKYFFGAFDTPPGWRWHADEITVPEDVYRTILARIG